MFIVMMMSYPRRFTKVGCPYPPFPMMSCLYCLCMCGLGLCPFSGLVRDLLLRRHEGLSLKVHHQKSISSHMCDGHYLEDTRVTWCHSYQSGGAPFVLRFLVVMET